MFEDKPFLLHQDASILQNSPDFVHCDLDLNQQPAVSSPYGYVVFHTIVGEAGESERAIGPHVVTQAFEGLDDSTAIRPASN